MDVINRGSKGITGLKSIGMRAISTKHIESTMTQKEAPSEDSMGSSEIRTSRKYEHHQAMTYSVFQAHTMGIVAELQQLAEGDKNVLDQQSSAQKTRTPRVTPQVSHSEDACAKGR